MLKSIPEYSTKSILSVLFCLFLSNVAITQEAIAASLSGSFTATPGTVNLSTNSPADWIHWGYVPVEFDRKAGVTPQITNFTNVNGADPGATDKASAAYSWNDGVAPGGNISGTRTGERVFQVGKGFQFTVPANTSLKTLRVYIGSSASNGRLTATLSDGSAPAYNFTINQPSGSKSSREVTLNFRAGSAGQRLIVRYVVTARNTAFSFITLESAALQNVGGGGIATLSGSAANVSNVNLSTKGPADWIHWGRISDKPWDRKSGITPLITDQVSVGIDVSPTSFAVDPLYTWNDGRPNASISTRTGLRLFGQNKGFKFTAPAGTSARTLKVYVGLNNKIQGKLTATLSDGSAPAYSATISRNSIGRTSNVFTINYQAATNGKLLTVVFIRTNPLTNGTWISLEAAQLLGGGGGGGTQPPSSPPANVTASDDTFTSKIAVNWSSVTGATSYQVYRSTSAGTNGALRASPTGTSYDDTNATAGTNYFYRIKACNSAGCSGFSTQDAGRRAGGGGTQTPLTPTNVSASDDTFTSKIAVTWNAVSSATNYQIYRSTTSGTTGALFTSPTGNSFDDTSAIAGTRYYYTIKACNSGGCSAFSAQDAGRRAVNSGGTIPAAPPSNVTASVNAFPDKVTVNWGTVTGATFYELWRSTVPQIKGTQIGLPTGTRFDDTTATPGTDYWYGLKACNSAGCSGFSGQAMGRRATSGNGKGSLSGTPAIVAPTVDLSTQGPVDWVHWGRIDASTVDRKANVSPQIGNYTPVNGANPSTTTDITAGYSWTDGTPATNATNSKTGLRVFKLGKGLEFKVPAGTTSRTLEVYVGVNAARGLLEASLSDNSAPVYSTLIDQLSGRSSQMVTLNFQAASAGQTLTIRYTLDKLYLTNFKSWATLESAALQGGSIVVNQPPTLSAIANQVVTEGQLLTIAISANDVDGPAPVMLTETNNLPGSPSVITDSGNGNGQLNWTPSIGAAARSPYTVVIKATDGNGNSSSKTVLITVNPQGTTNSSGSLSGITALAPATINLSTEGSADWIHWGRVDAKAVDRKSVAATQISSYTPVSGANPGSTTSVTTGYSWIDGTLLSSTTNNKSGLWVFAVGRGFEFTVPANTVLKTLKVYVGANAARGRFEASLSDDSAPAFSTFVDQPTGRSSQVVTLDFKAASSDQTLTVRYTIDTLYLNNFKSFVTLESASLK